MQTNFQKFQIVELKMEITENLALLYSWANFYKNPKKGWRFTIPQAKKNIGKHLNGLV